MLDISGQRFSRLLVLRRTTGNRWVCLCDCGNETLATAAKLRYGHKGSCGCQRRDHRYIPQAEDLTGQKFGRLAVVQKAGKRHGENVWLCRCDCGQEVSVKISNLKSGTSQSCGCLAAEVAAVVARNNFKHRIIRTTLPFGESSLNGLYQNYVRGARKRNLVFDISKETFRGLTQMACNYCGAEPSRSFKGNRGHGGWKYNGLDRVDNSIGYTPQNVVPCCIDCNRAKHAMTLSAFHAWIRRLHQKLSERSFAAVAS